MSVVGEPEKGIIKIKIKIIKKIYKIIIIMIIINNNINKFI